MIKVLDTGVEIRLVSKLKNLAERNKSERIDILKCADQLEQMTMTVLDRINYRQRFNPGSDIDKKAFLFGLLQLKKPDKELYARTIAQAHQYLLANKQAVKEGTSNGTT